MPMSPAGTAVLAWHEQHRMDSPYPLRHNGTNFHITERSTDEVRFVSYIFVTQVEGLLPSSLSSGRCAGAVRQVGDSLLIAAMDLTLDMTPSVTFRDRP